MTADATTTKLAATPAELTLRNTMPTTMVHSHTITPRGGEGGRPPPAASQHPTDTSAGEKWPCRSRQAGDAQSFGVAATSHRAEHQHGDDVGGQPRQRAPWSHAARLPGRGSIE